MPQEPVRSIIDRLRRKYNLPEGGQQVYGVYQAWSARPTKRGTPERNRAEAALAVAQVEHQEALGPCPGGREQQLRERAKGL
jgi:hypothetical protein